jgi:tripartite-type tricarboxylate transporter receptor subunit TctC
MKSRLCSIALLSVLGTFVPAHAQQDYPSKSIRLITPAAQGGTTDILARTFGARLSDVFKQQVVVDNRASASGVIAGELTANAPADGYTLLLAYHQHTINAALMAKLPYHSVNSFTPITQLTEAAQLLVVNSSSPPKNLNEFVAWTRTIREPLNFGSAGIGSGGHLAGELYKQMAGVKAEHIPYKGTAPSRRNTSSVLRDCRGRSSWYAPAAFAQSQSPHRSGLPHCPICLRRRRPCRDSKSSAGTASSGRPICRDPSSLASMRNW